MLLDLTCPHCERLIRTAAEHAGKTAACPQCGKEMRIPAAQLPTSPTLEATNPWWKTTATAWYVQAEDGRQFGPVSGEQLHLWYEEGRITENCQLLRKGAAQWQWATDLYPDLQEAPAAQAPAAASNINPSPSSAESSPATPRAAPTQSASSSSSSFIALDPSDFPSAGAGLKPLGPIRRALPPGYEEPRYHSLEALENRRKYAPHMVARVERKPVPVMLMVVAILNFVVGTVRGVLFFVNFIGYIVVVVELGQNGDGQQVGLASLGVLISFVMVALNIAIISGGIGLLQMREWGRTATFVGTLLNLLIQLIVICVTTMLGADAALFGRSFVMVLLLGLLPSILYDIFAAGTLAVPSIVENLGE